jgi:hypothetical protein
MITGKNILSSAHPVISPDKEASPQKIAAHHPMDILILRLLESLSRMRLIGIINQDPRQCVAGGLQKPGGPPSQLQPNYPYFLS